MNGRNWFNARLYSDTLWQLRVAGFAYLVVCLAVSWIPPVVIRLGEPWDAMSIDGFVPALYLMMSFGAIAMVFQAFFYLFGRNGSDAFHALPTARQGLCISRFLAVCTWLWGIIAVTVLGTVLMYGLLCGQWYFSFIPWLLGYHAAIALFFAASALCAVSLTGTWFAALAVTGLVAFLFRFLLLLFGAAMVRFAPVISYQDFGLLLNPVNNIATATFMLPANLLGTFSQFNVKVMMTSLWPICYTFAIGCAYAALGVWLYSKRRNETAGKSAPNALVQAAIRCGVTLPILLPFAITLALQENDLLRALARNEGIAAFALVLSLLVHLSFEVLTKKHFKRLWRALPSYAALLAFCVLFVIAAKAMAYNRLHTTPGANEIRFVCLSQEEGNSYYDCGASPARLESAQASALFAQALRDSVARFEAEGSAWNAQSAQRMQVRMVLQNGQELVRNVVLDQSQAQRLSALLVGDAAFMQRIRSLPQAEAIQTLHTNESALTDARLRILYPALAEEMQALPDQDFAFLVGVGPAPDSVVVVDRLVFSGQCAFAYYSGSIALSSLTPNALWQYVSLVRQRSNDCMLDYLPTSSIADWDREVSLVLYDLDHAEAVCASVRIVPNEAMESGWAQALGLVRASAQRQQARYLLKLVLKLYSGPEPDEYEEQMGYVYLSDEQAATLAGLLPLAPDPAR